jgi:hypothetical protein
MNSLTEVWYEGYGVALLVADYRYRIDHVDMCTLLYCSRTLRGRRGQKLRPVPLPRRGCLIRPDYKGWRLLTTI